MKNIKPVFLTIFSAIAFSSMGFVSADTATTVSSDGFLELTVEEAPVASTAAASKPAKVVKKAKTVKRAKPKKSVRTKRAERKKRQQRAERKKRAMAKRMKRSKTYRVRSGDTLTQISKKTGVSVNKLVRLNRLYGSKKNRLEIGQRLRLR